MKYVRTLLKTRRNKRADKKNASPYPPLPLSLHFRDRFRGRSRFSRREGEIFVSVSTSSPKKKRYRAARQFFPLPRLVRDFEDEEKTRSAMRPEYGNNRCRTLHGTTSTGTTTTTTRRSFKRGISCALNIGGKTRRYFCTRETRRTWKVTLKIPD